MLLFIKLHCLAFLISGFTPQQTSLLGGLKFHGSEQPINQRTSYDVFGDKTVEFADHFDVEFSLSLYPTTEFGYILRIKNRENNKIYNLFYDGQGRNHVFKFNEEGTHTLILAQLGKEELPDMQWFKMKISFDLKEDSISLKILDRTFRQKVEDFPHTYHPIILFGKSDHIIDVPSFAIKDLSIGNEERYFFPLKEIEGNVVHEKSGRIYGKVSNPEWLMNDAYHWRYKTSFRSKSVAGANYNEEKKEIYYFNRDSLHIYNVTTNETQVKAFEGQCPVKLILGTNFIDTKRNKLYSYEVYSFSPGDNATTSPTVASLDLDTYRWTPETAEHLPSPFHHHGSYLDPVTGQYTIFGGFGNMHYSKDFFSYDLEKKDWEIVQDFTGDRISPRYFSSVGYLKKTNSIYIFGGMGNESGEQTVGRKYYYDLYKVDLNTRNITRLWKIEWKQDNVVPVRGMVILDDSCFYTLCYPEHFTESFLKLYRFSLQDGRYEILGDSIPIYSDKITTNANLYYDSGLNNLYAVVQEFKDDISSTLKVYSLAFPPITAQELASYSKYKNDNTLAVVLLSGSLVTIIGYLLLKKMKAHRNIRDNEQRSNLANGKDKTPTRPNSICLFGDFTVRDKNNRDITYLFSEQLKQIFCLILQHSATEDGIASQRLSNILWPDRPADKVKNSRGVNINRLRKVLGELDGVELVYEKGHFKIVQNDKFYCDYTRCLEIISMNEREEHRDELIEILSRGKFLQFSDHPLFDDFKEEMEKKLEPVLLLELEKSYDAELYQATLAFSEAIFNIDPLNDMALTYQIKAMQRLKMNDEAKMKYQAFVIEYKKVMGNDYPHPFKSLN